MKTRRSILTVVTLIAAIGLLAGSVQAQTTTLTGTANGPGGSDDNWDNPANWTAGIPAGTQAAVITNGLFAQIDDSSGLATPYSGGLTLGTGSRLQVGWTTNYATNINALGTGTITMNDGSQIIARSGLGTYTFNQPFVLNAGSAVLWGGISTANHGTTKTFSGGISGPGKLIYNGVNNTVFVFNTDNSLWTGGFESADPQNQRHNVRASANGAFGTGNVAINNNCSLEIAAGLSSTINDTATLYVTGVRSTTSGWATKLILKSNETVTDFWLNGVQQAPGTYDSSSGLLDSGGNPLISGSGILTVLGSSPMVYWDLNASGGGAGGANPAGTWNASNTYWNAAADGTGSTAAWTAGRTAVFAAGGDATGTYTVAVSGTHDIGGLGFEEGTVTLSGGGLRMTGDSLVNVASGLTATIATTISDDATPRLLSKAGDGTLVLAGANTYSGVTAIGNGILSVSSLANAGSSSNLGAYPTAGAGGLILGGGTLQYTGGTTAIDRGFTLTNSSTIDITTPGTALTLGACESSGSNGTLTVTGAAGSSLALGEVKLVQGIGMTLNPTVSGMTVASVVGDTRYGLPAPTLTLGGTTTGNVIPGSITHINIHPSGWDPSVNVAKSDSGTWTLAGTSTYTGTTSVNEGTLIAAANAPSNSNGAFGKATSDVNLGVAGGSNDAALLIGGPYTVGRNIRLLTSNTTDAGTRVLTLGGSTAANSVFSGNIYLGTNNNAGRGVTLTAAAGGQVTFSGVIQNPSGMDPTTYTVTKAGAGTVVLSGNNTYTGLTEVQAGTLRLDRSGGTIADTSAVQVSGGTLDVAQDDVVGDVTLSSGTISGAATLTGTSYALTDTGLISANLGANSAALTKTGAGTATLAGTNAYTGGTNVNEGTLIVNGSVLGAVNVAGGATLGGTGTVGGAVVSGILAPGGSIGTLTIAGDATIGGKLLIEVDGAGAGSVDVLNVGELLNITGATVEFDVLTDLDDPFYVFASYGSLGGTPFLDVLDLPPGYEIDYDFQKENLIALVEKQAGDIPEPVTMALLTLVAAGLGGYVRRRRKA